MRERDEVVGCRRGRRSRSRTSGPGCNIFSHAVVACKTAVRYGFNSGSTSPEMPIYCGRARCYNYQLSAFERSNTSARRSAQQVAQLNLPPFNFTFERKDFRRSILVFFIKWMETINCEFVFIDQIIYFENNYSKSNRLLKQANQVSINRSRNIYEWKQNNLYLMILYVRSKK